VGREVGDCGVVAGMKVAVWVENAEGEGVGGTEDDGNGGRVCWNWVGVGEDGVGVWDGAWVEERGVAGDCVRKCWDGSEGA
jgi:hypothetical protein